MKLAAWSIPVLSLLTVGVHAEDDKPFAMDAEVGALLTSGNTESTTFKGKLDIKQEFIKWRHNYIASAIYKEDEVEISASESASQTTAEKYLLSLQTDYKLNEEHSGLFIFGSYEEDRFSGYDYQASLATGYTDRLFETDSSHLNYSIGVGSSFNKTDDVYDDAAVLIEDGESSSSAIIRLAFDYRYNFSENAKFTQTFSSDFAPESNANTKTKAESAVTANLNSSFALRFSFTVTNNSEVPDNIENTDTQTGLAIVYSR